MKKIAGLMTILTAAAALAAPAMARDRDNCYVAPAPVYATRIVRRDIRGRHEVRGEVRPVRVEHDRR